MLRAAAEYEKNVNPHKERSAVPKRAQVHIQGHGPVKQTGPHYPKIAKMPLVNWKLSEPHLFTNISNRRAHAELASCNAKNVNRCSRSKCTYKEHLLRILQGALAIQRSKDAKHMPIK